MKNFIIFGAQGVGKGTQAAILAKNLDLIHISSGDLLRDEIKSDSELGKKVQTIVAAGNLVDDEIVFQLIEKKIDSNPSAKGFIFDGFPRNLAQAKALDALLEHQGCSILGVFVLEAPEEELLRRLIKRAQEEGRMDDTTEVIQNRLKIYHEKTKPLIDYYFTQNKILIIDGNRPIELISGDIKKLAARF